MILGCLRTGFLLTTATTQAAFLSPATVQFTAAETDPAPTSSTLLSQETLSERSIQSDSDHPGFRWGGLLTYWPFAALSLGVSVLVAVNVIQRRIANQRPSPKEENTN